MPDMCESTFIWDIGKNRQMTVWKKGYKDEQRQIQALSIRWAFSIHGIGEVLEGVTSTIRETSFFAGIGQDISRELWKYSHYFRKSSKEGETQWFFTFTKIILGGNVKRSGLMVRHPILSLMRLVFVKLKVEIRQLQEKNIQKILRKNLCLFDIATNTILL